MSRRPQLTHTTQQGFHHLIKDGEVLQYTQGEPAVVINASGTRVIKIWHRQKGFSSDRLWPYGYRFCFNSKKLLGLGIEAPRVERYVVVRESGAHVVIYQYLPGESVQKLAEQGCPVPEQALAAFLAELHNKGIYFRSIHPGNILMLQEGRFALLDVTDVRFYSRPLSLRLRVRNLLYAWTRDRYRHVYPQERRQALLDYYCQHAMLGARDEARFLALMRRVLDHSDVPPQAKVIP